MTGSGSHHHLSDADAFALMLERDPVLRSTIVAIATLDQPPSWPVLVERVERATRLSPQFRMKLAFPPLPVAPPCWVVDPDFDLRWHLRRSRLPGDGARSDLLELARNLGMEAFDLDRPLWMFTLVDGLEDGRAALVIKVHHSLTDGIGGIELAANVVDLQREPADLGPLPEAPTAGDTGILDEWTAPIAVQAERLAGSLRRAAGVAPRAALRAATRPVATVGEAIGTGLALARFARPITSQCSTVMTERSLRRHFSELDLPFDRLRAAARRVDATVNDAFLSGISGGMRHYHELHGAPVDRLRLVMPVNVREPDDPIGGNRVTLPRFEVPVGIADPGVRTAEIGRLVRQVRSDPAIPLSQHLASVLNLLPVSITGGMLKRVDFVASDVPGFREQVYLAGSRIDAFHAFSPTLGSAVNVTLMSYAGTCHLGVNTDEAAIPDPDTFLTCLQKGFDEVLGLAG